MRRALVAVCAAFVAATVAVAAEAAVRLLLGRAGGAPGDSVAVRTSGAIGASARLFLLDPAGDPPRFALGRMERDRKRVGRLAFRVPNLPAREYSAVLERRGRQLGRARFRIAEGRPPVRDCASSVWGQLSPDWPRHAVRAGPLSLYAFGGRPAKEFDPVDGRPGYYWPVKMLVLVDTGATATLRVPPSERRVVSLTHGGHIGGGPRGMRVGDAFAAVTFESCVPSDEPQTQFNGSFVVAGARCAHLEVHVKGRAEPLPLLAPFGRAC